ncbi:VCBS repeat-containing protein [Adhaeribacter radiodurans]|uniref:VCBS repeat-containing protein n=1 Tax=Adhaeribacter radiodurans TaxID=2745197 RepID=A0A7L7LDV2_9BACT|nr:VCBS repeat-containing protein [Adhaeribacter radiodurans]QMU30715.1 VCBS repeat-containing protein [Adhaeribacter radiodurans]
MNKVPFLMLAIFSLIVSSCQKKSETLFTQLDPDDTGITFSNRILESDSLNILTEEYIYNGGGVAIGDFNGDGLDDVYFTGNMVQNKLYLNQGNFKFKDITATAGVTGNGKWSSGVAVVDINQDGRLDMYVCATIKKDPADRANMLFVNQGNNANGEPVFKNLAPQYGIADTGYSTNAAFFDYDHDGDLDLYVLTNVQNESIPTVYRPKVNDGTSPNNDRLYRNNGNGTFTNVSKAAGIIYEGYGLGLAISDINLDGWPDIYVTNDYLSDDLLYINNHDGTFTNRKNEYIKHTSFSAMGNSVADINNDGLVDILAVDMLPENNKRKKLLMKDNNYAVYFYNKQYNYDFQYVRNTLQLNNGPRPNGEPSFSEIGQLSGIYQTDWSWTPLMADFDNDGYRDIIITNGFPKDVTDRDFSIYRSGPVSQVANLQAIVDSIPVIKIPNYAYHNNGNLTFADKTKDWGLGTPSFSNGAAYADLDNDGDLDLIVNNINDSAFVYQNQLYASKKNTGNNHFLRLKFEGEKPNWQGVDAKVSLFYDQGKKQYYENTAYRGFLSSVENKAHFGLGNATHIDSLKVIWPDGKMQLLRNVKINQVLTLKQSQARSAANKPAIDVSKPLVFQETAAQHSIQYQHQEDDKIDFNIQKTLPHKFTQSGPGIAVGDINGDNLDDFYVGGSAGKNGTFFLQQPTGKFKASTTNYTTPKPEEDMGMLFLDVDNDSDLDLYVASGSYEFQEDSPKLQDRLYKNNGKGQFTLDTQALPALRTIKSCVKAADFDRDGDLDLFIGGRVIPGKYPLAPPSYILRNEGGKFIDVTQQVCPALTQLGMISDALWSDFDNDGQVDLVIAGEWMPVTFLKNNKGKLQNVTGTTGVQNQTGWWNSLAAGDFDNDGDIDYVAGNLGLNSNYCAKPNQPLQVIAKDFDKNGSIDAVLSCYLKSEDGQMRPYPMHTRDDLNAQLPRTRSIFARYGNYAMATIDDVIPAKEREGATILQATHFASSYLENLGQGKFKMHELPQAVQFAPVYGLVADDVNQDGNLDLLLVGNDYSTEVFTGNYDALIGLYLQGNGTGKFTPLPASESGFFVNGDAKGMAQLYTGKGEKLTLVTQNQDSLKVWQTSASLHQREEKIINLQPMDAIAEITYTNGRKQRVEFYYGHTYLSQSARKLVWQPGMATVEIKDFSGRSRKLTF